MAKATLTFTSTQEPPTVHPANDWIQHPFEDKKHQILASDIAALLTIKKTQHIKPFIAPESAKADKNWYRGSGTINMKEPYPVYLIIQNIQDHVFTIMEKQDAKDFKFPFINKDICDKIDNLSDPAGQKFSVATLPPDFPQDLTITETNDDPNKNRIPVLTMIPTIMPIGFGRDPPQGDITLGMTLMTCQSNDPHLRTGQTQSIT
jgi:hypothetical protein